MSPVRIHEFHNNVSLQLFVTLIHSEAAENVDNRTWGYKVPGYGTRFGTDFSQGDRHGISQFLHFLVFQDKDDML